MGTVEQQGAAGGRPDRLHADTWHTLKLVFLGDTIRAAVDGSTLAQVADGMYHAGMIGLGSGWNGAQFGRVAVDPAAADDLAESK